MTDLPAHRRIAMNSLNVGDEFATTFRIHLDDARLFASATSDDHPLHVGYAFPRKMGYPEPVIHGTLLTARAAAYATRWIVGTEGLLLSISGDFLRPAFLDQLLHWTARVNSLDPLAQTMSVSWRIRDEDGSVVQRGQLLARLPAQ